MKPSNNCMMPNVIIGTQQAILTSSPSILEGPVCPTVVRMVCIVQDLPRLIWFFNGVPVTIYSHSPDDVIPPPRDLNSYFPGVDIQIISAQQDSLNADFVDATSVLSMNITILEDFGNLTVKCGSNQVLSSSVQVTDISTQGE